MTRITATTRSTTWAIALALTASVSTPAAGQTPATIIPGKTQLAFDQPDSTATTERYELCFGTTALTCFPITPTRVGTTGEYRFTVPTTVLAGQRPYSVWALGARGRAGSASVVLRVPPIAPSALRVPKPPATPVKKP